MPRKRAPKKRVAKAMKKPKASRRVTRKAPRDDIDQRVEHFAEEMETLGKRASENIRAGRVRRLYRSGKDKILGGVCGGIAEHFGIDPVLVRIIWVLVSLAWGFGILLYLICWIIIPRNPRHRW